MKNLIIIYLGSNVVLDEEMLLIMLILNLFYTNVQPKIVFTVVKDDSTFKKCIYERI